MHVLIYLMVLTLSATDGHEVSRKVENGPYRSVELCSQDQQKTGTQQPKDGLITVHVCAAGLRQ